MLLVTRTRWIAQSALLLGVCLLVGCEEKADVPVNLHGINYGGETFSYYVKDPAKLDSSEAGGELIDAFSAGGTTCCFTLPKKWRPGIKVQVRTTHWLPARPDGSLPEVKQVQVVDVPPYVDGVAGELWIWRAADGSVGVVSSDFQPDHDKWPGKVKGWPVPSLEYRRERWRIYRKQQESFIMNNQTLLDKLEKAPLERSTLAWEHASRYSPEELTGFAGPADPRYTRYLIERYEEGLTESSAELERLLEEEP